MNTREIEVASFTELLYTEAKPIWEKTHLHPFITGIANGNLPVSAFIHYMKQDYLFLQEYAKLFAIASVKANRIDWSGRFAKIMTSTLQEEMSLHRGYAQRLGISHNELETAEPSFVMLAYTSYMLQIAHQGILGEAVSALLPCMWSYQEIGKRLAQKSGVIDHPKYGEWVRMYSSDEFAVSTDWLKGVLDEIARDSNQQELARMKQHFIATCKMEYLFWDMAYLEQIWP
ncbi:thiaminase II [Brevibacillus laterosporus]|uniref:thiaminase II n=1 Tax=Brevibacillus laterosporus TaxID=1465 RepID=UPI000CE55EB3|nr:thiaminase II [Brevibacillus laterosporus]MED1663149.1 thiaminase II [Brevibacillus laterosporus]MED1669638.1 thiaminase II [Brevibacillus laterosporus]MED1718814.1 thiaminase II [Brevibacillus laterosporus]PPA89207.1 thiaminase II [Brevibacillus laterosporus]